MRLLSKPKHPEIDQLTMKMIVGVIAISIAFVTSVVSNLERPLTSISESYFAGDWSRGFFVGFLYIIAAFLLCYNGQTRAHMVLSKLAALASFGVAMFPCKCRDMDEIIPYVHYASAAVMFAILAFFCLEFYRHASAKGHRQASWRSWIYLGCFWAIALSIIALGTNAVLQDAFSKSWSRFVFFCEMTGLVAFGVCWLVASRVLPVLTAPSERHRLFSVDPPGQNEPESSRPQAAGR